MVLRRRNRRLILSETRVVRGELCDRRPVECLAAAGEQCQEAIAQQAGQRHRDAQRFGRREGEPDVLLSQAVPQILPARTCARRSARRSSCTPAR